MPEPDRLAVDEVAAGPLLQVVEEEMLDPFDVARVPARRVEGLRLPSGGRP